jgi:hypothetical protein
MDEVKVSKHEAHEMEDNALELAETRQAARVHEAAHGRPDSPIRLIVAFGLIAVSIVGALILGLTIPAEVPGQENEGAAFLGGFNGWGALGIAAGTILLGWALSGRWLLKPLGDLLRRHRVGLHTWTSMAALSMALIHSAGLTAYHDLLGWASGSLSLLLMVLLFATGWWRTHWVKAWGLRTWRWVHWELAVGAVLLGFEHWLLVEHAKEAVGLG